MDKTTLVEADISRGRELLAILNAAGYPVRRALWAYAPERYSNWRLLIATPLVDEHGPLAAYRRLDAVLRKDHPELIVWLQEVQLVSPGSPLMQSLRKAYPPGERVFDPLISGSTSNTHLEQAYLYEMHGTTE